MFESDEEVVATEKIHGTNLRCRYVPFHADTLWKKIKKFFGRAPKYEFVYGSHNVQLQSKLIYNGFYDENVYSKAVGKYQLKDKLVPGMVIYGEIYGHGIQKNYTYGCKEGEHKLVVFDIQIDGQYVDHDKLVDLVAGLGLEMPPVLYRGPFDKEKLKSPTEGDSVMVPSQKVREGLVVKPINEQSSMIGRKILKMINDEYLLKDQTDFH